MVTEIPVSGEPPLFGANWDGWLGTQPLRSDLWLDFHHHLPPSFFVLSILSVANYLSILFFTYLPFVNASLWLRCPAHLLLSVGLVFLCGGLTHPLYEPSQCLVITDYIDLWDL